MLLENERSARAHGHAGAPSPSDGTEPGTRLTLGQAIERNAARFPDQPAIVSTSFAPLTYHELQWQVREIRRQLRHAGFDCGARIGVLMPSGPEAVLALVAVACCCVAVPLDPRLTLAELDQRLDLLHLNALLLPRGNAAAAREIARRKTIATLDAAPLGRGRLGLGLAGEVRGSPCRDTEPDPASPAFILPTSGTTARPKLIPFSHANMLAAAARLQAWFGLTPRDRCLNVSPPYYSHGLKVTVFTPLLTGGSIAIPTDSAAIDLTEWFETLRPTWYSAGPTLHHAVLDKAGTRADVAAKHALRFVIAGGAPLPRVVREELQAVLKVPVLEHYGSSEAAQIAANQPPPGASRPGTCGMPWPGTVAIVDQNGHPLPHGRQGEIWVCGPTVMTGYLDDPDLNRHALVDGWLRTGDLGSLDKDGFLTLHGRLTEVINRGGEKVSPVEVDAALQGHPAIAEAASFAVPHPRYGEDVAAAVVLRPGASVTPIDLRQFLRGVLAPFKVPRHILIQDRLPKGITGKIQRRQLAQAFSVRADKAVRADPQDPGEETEALHAELLRIWRRLLKSSALTIDDDFFESGGDSLLATEMVLEVERMIGRPVAATILVQAGTIRHLARSIVAREGSPAGAWAEFNKGGSQTPLFFFLADDLERSSALLSKLVRLLPPDQPIVLIEPHGSQGDAIPPSIEQMAMERLPLILDRVPEGPCRIMGFCKGALIAFEVTRLLSRSGRRVEFVGLIDPPTISARPSMRWALSLAGHLTPPAGLAWIYNQLSRYERVWNIPWTQKLARTRALMPGERSLASRSLSELYEVYTPIMARYLPDPLDVPIVFYAAEYRGHAWRRLSRDLTVVELPGDHNYCIATGADVLAQDLRRWFGAQV
ncbi:AMP-binding protein [Methylobacterium oryzisoli]|uniref:AMP-binding protein n=1 Tax=Methylobacterium oryzisoli TaxID=3385502 RepID=UPI003891ACAE